MTFPTIDVLLKKINNKYLLANAVAERAKEISDGSIPYIEDPNPLNPIETAMEEFGRGKVEVKILDGPPQKAARASEVEDFWAREGHMEKEGRKRRSKASESLEKETRKKSKSPKKK